MPKQITPQQIEHYQREGYLVLEGFLSDAWLQRLQQVTTAFIEQSRDIEKSNSIFDLEPDHTHESPRLRRLNNPTDQHETYWEFSSQSEIVDIAEDILGENIKFHHSKLNFKFPHGGEEVKWHQDIQFWPHTNYDLMTIGVYLEDVVKGQGEMGFIPKSHDGPLYDQYEKSDQHEQDVWRGYIQPEDLPKVDSEHAVFPTGKAGTVTIHNCRTIHGSYPNNSPHQRPLLLQTYTAADAFAYTDLVKKTRHGEHIIRGNTARWARHDPRPCLVPPIKMGTIFQAQQKEV
ncbi:MAG: ectoine hydroxylase-related dioxygenase (phytanoyl-CoA dioxygenase family) [Candidatus Azotimanducaceae bacterium]|jgi:ectoine hydroxylase